MSAAYKFESLTPTPSEEPRPKRPRPINKRVFGSIAKSTSKVIDEGFREALTRDPKRYGDALRDGLPIATGVIEGVSR